MDELLPNVMQVVEITQAGGPEVLKPATRELPNIGPQDVLIKVEYAGVNRPDCLQRAGSYAPPPDASDLPGLEVAGKIVAVGDNISVSWIGENVTALTPGGGYAEYCVAPFAHCLSYPKNFDSLSAAALPENYFTVWHNVFERGKLSNGECFLVHGGSSGIGSTSIQLAKQFGAYVITTVGSDEKVAFCKSLGADLVINYKEDDFADKIIDEIGINKVHLTLDMVGGEYIDKHYKLASIDGRIIQIAFLQSAFAKPNFARLMAKRLIHTGSTLRPQSIQAKAEIAHALKEKIWPLLEKGNITPYIDKVFPLEEAGKAHEYMETSQHMGKIMLKTRFS